MHRDTTFVLPGMVTSSDSGLDIVGVLDDRGNHRFDRLLGKTRPASKDGVIGAPGPSNTRDVRRIRPVPELFESLSRPENSDYMMDVSEVNIDEWIAPTQCGPELLPCFVREASDEEEH